ncbi:helix-turn-helix domain-containing protein [Companilactobacillus farciminis]|uniref:helix-turn-helix domain-containing protein n=1 Tax=Companilactobacillus farciminis TaxID=1612 RepID=UPI0019159535|nr:helix-turn-helix domain-containing protein [Companilactobacillus farciminis]
MDFGAQMKKLRTSRELTQEQVAQKLNVSRQTISSWENNRNLPDLEMVVLIARIFNISLDNLILGDPTMTNKLVKDGSEMKRAKWNLYFSLSMIFAGIISFLLFRLIGSTVDSNGYLQEPFFLVPIGYLFLLVGLIDGVIYLVQRFKRN